MANKYPFWKPFLVLSAIGLIGVLSLLWQLLPQLDQTLAALPEAPDLPVSLLVILSLLQSAILVLVAVAIGCLTAPRVGLVSLIYEKSAYGTEVLTRLKQHLGRAAILGLAFAVVAVLFDLMVMPFAGSEISNIDAGESGLLGQLGLGLLYGGITEELLLRWGVMSLLVWLGWKLFQRSAGKPGPVLIWSCNIIAAILFGLGHLPALAAVVPLTTVLVLRTVFLNALGGVVFGWLFWRHSLEVAMVAHAFTHIGFFVIRVIAIYLL